MLLIQVFKKFGIEKYDPTNEKFDPNRHNAVFQVPDPSKAPDTVAVVLKVNHNPHYVLIISTRGHVSLKGILHKKMEDSYLL